MTDPHGRAMELVDEGSSLESEGRMEAARGRFEEAARLEQVAADAVPVEQARTRGILRVSAVSAWMRARRFEDAYQLARRYLREPIAPGFARELHELLCEIQTRREAAKRLPQVSEQDAADVVADLLEVEADLARGRVVRTKVTTAA